MVRQDEGSPPPPNYQQRHGTTTELPPDYSNGTTYVIAKNTLHVPLIGVTQVKAHLCLLREIQALRTVVELGKDPRIAPNALALPPVQRWAWFVGVAVERFSRWVTSVKVAPLKDWVRTELPPVDVLMVWQAYTLNPIFYVEDCARLNLLGPLRELGERLLTALVEVRDISMYTPTTDLQSRWYERTRTVYDPLDAMGSISTHSLDCPECGRKLESPLINADGTGYLQQDFVLQCPGSGCERIITKETLGVAKFAHDLVLDPYDPQDVARYGNGVNLPGAYYIHKKGPDKKKADEVKRTLRDAHPLRRPPNDPSMSKEEWVKHILTVTEYSKSTLKASILSGLAARDYNVQRVLSAYTDDRPFSVDLVGSTVRLSTFAEKMYELGWTDPDLFTENAEDELILTHAISRYHAFLDLISADTQHLYVPTLDIDLVWHTHQMMGNNYIAHCANHDTVEQNFVSLGFDRTCRAWRERFGLPYTCCGCPLPGDKMLVRLGRVKNLLRSSKATGELIPLQREDAMLATHASDHNAFYIGTDANVLRERVIAKTERRQKRAVKKGQSPATHEPPFLHPLSIYYGPAVGSIIKAGATSKYGWVVGAGGGQDGYLAGSANAGAKQGMMMVC